VTLLPYERGRKKRITLVVIRKESMLDIFKVIKITSNYSPNILSQAEALAKSPITELCHWTLAGARDSGF
jgi:hypothetical protein